MPAASDELAFALGRPFAEQVAFFRGKLGNLVPTATWRDVWKAAHDTGFMVAGAAKADLLADLAAAVDKAIADGEGIQKFRQRFAEIVQKHGWSGWTGSESKAGTAWRTRVIYRTNMATSYAAGRLAQLQHFPLWVYKHSGAEHPRLQHKAWNGLTLPADHAFWKTHYPPNGWGCGCRVVGASSERGAKLLGAKTGYTEPPPGWNAPDARGRLPGIDEGWDYMPGATRQPWDKNAFTPECQGTASHGKAQPCIRAVDGQRRLYSMQGPAAKSPRHLAAGLPGAPKVSSPEPGARCASPARQTRRCLIPFSRHRAAGGRLPRLAPAQGSQPPGGGCAIGVRARSFGGHAAPLDRNRDTSSGLVQGDD